MNAKKLLCLALSALLALSLLAGCSGGTAAETTASTTASEAATVPATSAATTATTSAATTTEATTTEATTEAKLDFGGYEFTLGAQELTKYYPQADASGTYPDAQSQEWADRYAALEDEYNFTFNWVQTSYSYENVSLMLFSGDYPYDVQELRTAVAFPLAVRGQIANYDTAEMLAAGLDVNDPAQFYQPITQWTNINGGIWGVRFASKYYLPEFGYCMIFNKGLTEAAGYPADTLYQAVRDGKWNFSMYEDLCSKLVNDSDGDGTPNIYATGGGKNPYASEIMLAGGNAVTYENGKWIYTLNSKESMDGMQFMYDEFNTFGWRFGGGAGDSRNLFSQGGIGMLWAAGFYLTNSTITNCEFDYGVIPMPKGDNVDDYVDVLSTPIVLCMYNGNLDYDVNVKIMTLWSSVMNSQDNWQEVVMDQFCRGNETDFEMLNDYVLPKLKFGTYKLNSEMESYIEANCMNKIYSGELTAAAAVEAVMSSAQSMLDSMFNQK